jgi:hypothetical protein
VQIGLFVARFGPRRKRYEAVIQPATGDPSRANGIFATRPPLVRVCANCIHLYNSLRGICTAVLFVED